MSTPSACIDDVPTWYQVLTVCAGLSGNRYRSAEAGIYYDCSLPATTQLSIPYQVQARPL